MQFLTPDPSILHRTQQALHEQSLLNKRLDVQFVESLYTDTVSQRFAFLFFLRLLEIVGEGIRKVAQRADVLDIEG